MPQYVAAASRESSRGVMPMGSPRSAIGLLAPVAFLPFLLGLALERLGKFFQREWPSDLEWPLSAGRVNGESVDR